MCSLQLHALYTALYDISPGRSCPSDLPFGSTMLPAIRRLRSMCNQEDAPLLHIAMRAATPNPYLDLVLAFNFCACSTNLNLPPSLASSFEPLFPCLSCCMFSIRVITITCASGLLQKAKAELSNITNSSSSHRKPPPIPHKPSYFPGRQHTHLRGMDQDQPSTIQDATALDILRYRYHHGTNLGSIYVLERWLFPSRFPENAGGTSELEAVKAWVDKIGIDATKVKFEEAWENALSDADIGWLKNEAKCTTVRLPIGYYDLPGPEFILDTPFEPYAYIYSAAWPNICTLISRLRAHSIGVLLDIHALPGGANTHEHSGTNSGVAQFFSSQSNRDIGVRCCEFIAREARDGLNIVGLQVVNEAGWESDRIYDWYDECIAAMSTIDASIPVVISDAWNLNRALDYSMSKNSAYPSVPTCPVVVDTHFYWAFSDSDKEKTPQQIFAEVATKLDQLDVKEGSVIARGAAQAIVGEYSNVLSEESWAKGDSTLRQDLVGRFGAYQSRRYQQRAGGAFFWTWKMDWMPGGEWGFQAQASPDPSTGIRAISPPVHSLHPSRDMFKLLERAQYCKDERMYSAVAQHVSYWDHINSNQPSEHWRYENGWKVGYQDAYQFFEGKLPEAMPQGNKIGNLELWVMKRIRESGFRGGSVWEYEQGLRSGVRDFNHVVGI
ncbi:glycoside hydrolase family 5 protein [Lentithecium fluviatile CBS 122367]|uniref:Glycoside hydrolase family 5 protein n=1 Tax=Lentithecium fluviatile CBS 122367 TaxID=1168545 RepID=A0A6G1ID25_9PLEO|nr:glycoside hydrolase family 5 protein [Lentithecium fluviatile CBS 122367]